MNRSAYEVILDYMPHKLRNAMELVSTSQRSGLSEIRIRSGRPVSFFCEGTSLFIDSKGKCSDRKNALTADYEDICRIVENLSRHSLHSCTRQLRQGVFVIEGGIRVGLAGTYTDSAEPVIREVNGLNFRIAREVKGCAEPIGSVLLNSRRGMLICGGVNSGKTTLLRDLCRIVGNCEKVTLIDERNEISALVCGTPANDVGAFTDVICGISRYSGIVSAIRTLSPQFIICDEIASDEDCEAILSGHGCGVRFAATIHAENYEELMKRRVGSRLISEDVFSDIVFLGGKAGHIREVRSLT